MKSEFVLSHFNNGNRLLSKVREHLRGETQTQIVSKGYQCNNQTARLMKKAPVKIITGAVE